MPETQKPTPPAKELKEFQEQGKRVETVLWEKMNETQIDEKYKAWLRALEEKIKDPKLGLAPKKQQELIAQTKQKLDWHLAAFNHELLTQQNIIGVHLEDLGKDLMAKLEDVTRKIGASEWQEKPAEEISSAQLQEAVSKADTPDKKKEVAQNLTPEQIDQIEDKTLLYNFFVENGAVNFHGNRKLERKVGLGEITPNQPEFEYAKINGILCKRVQWIREYYEDKNGKYRIILDNYKVEFIAQEEGKKEKFPSEGKDVRAEQLAQLEKTNEPLAARLKTDQDFKIPKEAFFSLLKGMGQVDLPELAHTALNAKMETWKQSIKETGKVTETDLNGLLDQYLGNVKKSSEFDETEKKDEEEKITALKTELERIKTEKPKLFAQILEWTNQDTFSPLTFDAEGLKRIEEVFGQKDLKEISALDAETRQLLETEKWRAFLPHLPSLLIANQQTGVPLHKMVRLMIFEGSHGDPDKKNPYSSALGLWQMLEKTWQENKMPWLNDENDRHNAHYQIIAMANYLNQIHSRQNCNWEETLVYYHTGEGIKWLSNEKIAEYLDANPAIERSLAQNNLPKNADGYFQAAYKYYNAPMG